jgi:hypothetical protein
MAVRSVFVCVLFVIILSDDEDCDLAKFIAHIVERTGDQLCFSVRCPRKKFAIDKPK